MCILILFYRFQQRWQNMASKKAAKKPAKSKKEYHRYSQKLYLLRLFQRCDILLLRMLLVSSIAVRSIQSHLPRLPDISDGIIFLSCQSDIFSLSFLCFALTREKVVTN